MSHSSIFPTAMSESCSLVSVGRQVHLILCASSSRGLWSDGAFSSCNLEAFALVCTRNCKLVRVKLELARLPRDIGAISVRLRRTSRSRLLLLVRPQDIRGAGVTRQLLPGLHPRCDLRPAGDDAAEAEWASAADDDDVEADIMMTLHDARSHIRPRAANTLQTALPAQKFRLLLSPTAFFLCCLPRTGTVPTFEVYMDFAQTEQLARGRVSSSRRKTLAAKLSCMK
jgi:hypothetical protein